MRSIASQAPLWYSGRSAQKRKLPPSMPLKIQLALKANLETLVRLNQVVQQLHAELHPSRFKPTADSLAVRSFFAGKLSSENNFFVTAEIGDRPVGYVWFEIQALPETPFTFAASRVYIHHMAVVPEARRGGVATALMHHVEQQAVSEGISEIALDIWTANLNAQTFFSSHGYVSSKLMLRKRIIPKR